MEAGPQQGVQHQFLLVCIYELLIKRVGVQHQFLLVCIYEVLIK